MLLKHNLSVTLNTSIIEQIDILKERLWISRSQLIEELIKNSLEIKLLEDAKKLSKMNFDDIPSEDEWHILQSNN